MSNLNYLSTDAKLQADSAWSSGNYEDARRNASIAKILNIVGFSIGTLAWVIAVILIITSVAVNVSNRSYSSSSYYRSSYYN